MSDIFLYKGQYVAVNQIIKIDGLSIMIDANFINLNISLLEPVKEILITNGNYYRCIKDVVMGNKEVAFVKDKVYISFKDNSLVDEQNHVHTATGIFVLEHFVVSSKKEYDDQNLVAEAILRYPVGTEISNANLGFNCTFKVREPLFSRSGNEIILLGSNNFGSYTVYKDGKWANILEPVIFNSAEGRSVRNKDKVFVVQLKPTVEFKGEMQADISMKEGCVCFINQQAAKNFYAMRKEKTLQEYELSLLENNFLIKDPAFVLMKGHYYQIMKNFDPKLYWTKVLKAIADDFNGTWKPSLKETKYMIGNTSRTGTCIEAITHTSVLYGDVYFQTKEGAEKAIKIMGQRIGHIFAEK